MLFQAAVVSYYMWNKISIDSHQLPYLAFAVFSFVGVVAANSIGKTVPDIAE